MKRISWLISFIISISLYHCTTVPSIRVSQPWIRSLKSNHNIEPTKLIKIEVSGTTIPLLGSEQLLGYQLRSELSQLMIRRGFIIEDVNYDYLVRMSYRTERIDKMKYSSTISTANSQYYSLSTGAGSGVSSGLGVSVARAVSTLASRSSTTSSQSSEQIVSYSHTISIEISNREGGLLWKGESNWDSEELNILSRIIPALQLILSDLPSNRSIRPEIPEIKETHVNNFYRLECKDVWYTCPALPYRIYLTLYAVDLSTTVYIPRVIQDTKALAAYVDLVQTAEYALPQGIGTNYSDPLKILLWSNVTLGGQYFLGSKKTPVNILIDLRGESNGYYVERCKIATDEEYSDFKAKLTKWQATLSDYYDLYEK